MCAARAGAGPGQALAESSGPAASLLLPCSFLDARGARTGAWDLRRDGLIVCVGRSCYRWKDPPLRKGRDTN